jgi:site-specific recombinase XerD
MIVLNPEAAITDANQPALEPLASYLASISNVKSRATMLNALSVISGILTEGEMWVDGHKADPRFVSWHSLSAAHTGLIRSRLAETYNHTTVNKMLSALRGVIKEAWRLGYMTAEAYQRATDFKNVKGETLPVGREIAEGEILALVRACKADKSPAGARDIAIIGVLRIGLRRSELVSLHTADFDAETGKLKVLQGKGRKQRTVYLTNGSLDALKAWLAVRSTEAGALFTPINKGGKIDIRPMTDQSVYNMLKKRGKQAKLKNFSPHDFRRTFVGDLLDRGADIVTVQKLAGHASVNTTARYDRRPEAVKQKASELIYFPFEAE